MQDWLEHTLKSFVETELKAGAVNVAHRALDGVRKLVIVHHMLMVTGMLCALSFFATGFVFFTNGPQPALVFSSAVFAVSGGLLWFTCRRGTWIGALGLERQIDDALSAREAPAEGIDMEALAALIDQIVERKMQASAEIIELRPRASSSTKAYSKAKAHAPRSSRRRSRG